MEMWWEQEFVYDSTHLKIRQREVEVEVEVFMGKRGRYSQVSAFFLFPPSFCYRFPH